MDQPRKPSFPPLQTLDDLIRNPDGIDTLPWTELRELAKQTAARTAALREIENRILFRYLCANNPHIESDGFPRLLTANKIAEHFSVPESWVREQARLGHFPSVKLGHYVRFRLDDVKAYLDQIAKQSPHSVNYLSLDPTPDRQAQPSSQWPMFQDSQEKTLLTEIRETISAWATLIRAHANAILKR